MKRALIVCLLLVGCGSSSNPRGKQDKPRNVIFLIGDGMGISQITLTRLLHGRLALDDFPVTGLVRTGSADAWVTDSAAAATALSTGKKTNNGAIGVDPDGKPLQTILEQAKIRGLATGLVTTSRITHATPASFASHIDSRSREAEIARQYLDAGVDVLLGGGSKYFPADLIDAFKKKKYSMATDTASLKQAEGKTLGLFSKSHIPYVLDRTPGQTGLVQMTQKAIRILSDSPGGFFLMIEGARIDHACHASDAPSAVAEMKEFDAVIRTVLDFAKRDKNTLVIITADHGTGGMAFSEKVEAYHKHFDLVKASSESMAREVTGGRSLRDVLKERAGVTDLTAEEESHFKSAEGPYDPGTVIGEIVSKRCGVNFIPFAYRRVKPNTTHGHDGAMVPVYAFGPGADRFTGTLDNTDIPERIRKATGW